MGTLRDHGWGFGAFIVGPTRSRLAEAARILENPSSSPVELEYAGSVLKSRRSTIEHCIEGGHFHDAAKAREEHRRAMELLGRLEARIGAPVGRASEGHMHRVDSIIAEQRRKAADGDLLRAVEAKLSGR